MLIPVQLLLFGFCVLVQCVIAAQWVALVPPCSFHTTDHVFSLFYVIFLVIFVSLLSIKSKRIKDNYREGSFIFILMMLKIPIWLAWIIGSIILPEAYHNACFGESSQPRNIVMHRRPTIMEYVSFERRHRWYLCRTHTVGELVKCSSHFKS